MTWERVLAVAISVDEFAGDLAAARRFVPALATMVRDVLARLPKPDAPPGLVPVLLLEAMHDATTDGGASTALADWLAATAETLARLCGAPVPRDDDAFSREASRVASGLARLLDAWAERLPSVGSGFASPARASTYDDVC